MNSNLKPIFEFLVWDNCNNNCSFCWQREDPRLFNHNKRKEILDGVIEFINSDKFIKGSHILVCGGEIFDKPSDFEILDNFFRKIVHLMLEGTIDLLYINTNLIYKDLTGVYNLLKLIHSNNLFDRLKFTTSYDICGRFKSKEYEKLMLDNLIKITNTFSLQGLNVVTNMILTKQLCDKIISKELNILKFCNQYRCWVNLIPYIVLDDSLTATRSNIFKALLQVDKDYPGYLDRYIPNMSIKQEKWLYMYKDNVFQFCSSKLSECGHSVNFKRYSDKETCFCCDLNKLNNMR